MMGIKRNEWFGVLRIKLFVLAIYKVKSIDDRR